jgi:exodeoxyribonuclease VII large subunit
MTVRDTVPPNHDNPPPQRSAHAPGATLTVVELVALLSTRFAQDPVLQRVRVTGEIRGFNSSQAGHRYFELHGDQHARIACVLYASDARRQRFQPANGLVMEAVGSVSYYAPQGKIQIVVRELVPAGLSEVEQARQELEARLEQLGVFTRIRKSLPAWPRCIGVVTSEGSDAWHDIERTIRANFPLVHLLLAPAPTQGPGSAAAIASALDQLASSSRCCVILLARGGGSSDLAVFDDERIVTAIIRSPVPLVTGIGHASHLSLADRVADHHAITPSMAAAACVPTRESVVRLLHETAAGIEDRCRQCQAIDRGRLNAIAGRLQRLGTRDPIARPRELARTTSTLSGRAFRRKLDANRLVLGSARTRILATAPNRGVAARGRRVSEIGRRCDQGRERHQDRSSATLDHTRQRVRRHDPLRLIDARWQELARHVAVLDAMVNGDLGCRRRELAALSRRVHGGHESWIAARRRQVDTLRVRVELLDSRRVLAKGYALLLDGDCASPVTSIHETAVGQTLTAELADGRLIISVRHIEPDGSTSA